MIASMSKPTVSLVLGGGLKSAYQWRFQQGIHSLRPATMTIQSSLNGMIIGVPQTFEYFGQDAGKSC